MGGITSLYKLQDHVVLVHHFLMSSCCSTPSEPDSHQNSWLSPVIPALLSSSCCWLPTLVDIAALPVAASSATHSLSSVSGIITLLIIGFDFLRGNINRRSLRRAFLSLAILLCTRIWRAQKDS